MYTILDWLNLHNLDPRKTSLFLRAGIDLHSGKNPATPRQVAICPDWAKADADRRMNQAFSIYFQGLETDAIALKKVRWISDATLLPEKAPVTLHSATADVITVYCGFRNTAADMMALAHEMGHAYQIARTGPDFIPPVDREVAAFLAEHILLKYAQATHNDAYPALKSVRDTETLSYLAVDGPALLRALDDPTTPYDYRQNYPLARILAANIFATGNREQIWRIFRGSSAIPAGLTADAGSGSLVA